MIAKVLLALFAAGKMQDAGHNYLVPETFCGMEVITGEDGLMSCVTPGRLED
jgi:hypothetical protein